MTSKISIKALTMKIKRSMKKKNIDPSKKLDELAKLYTQLAEEEDLKDSDEFQELLTQIQEANTYFKEQKEKKEANKK